MLVNRARVVGFLVVSLSILPLMNSLDCRAGGSRKVEPAKNEPSSPTSGGSGSAKSEGRRSPSSHSNNSGDSKHFDTISAEKDAVQAIQEANGTDSSEDEDCLTDDLLSQIKLLKSAISLAKNQIQTADRVVGAEETKIKASKAQLKKAQTIKELAEHLAEGERLVQKYEGKLKNRGYGAGTTGEKYFSNALVVVRQKVRDLLDEINLREERKSQAATQIQESKERIDEAQFVKSQSTKNLEKLRAKRSQTSQSLKKARQSLKESYMNIPGVPQDH